MLNSIFHAGAFSPLSVAAALGALGPARFQSATGFAVLGLVRRDKSGL